MSIFIIFILLIMVIYLFIYDIALSQVRASVSEKDLEFYLKFDEEHGSKR